MTTRGRRAVSMRDDELLSRLYQRLADEHAAEFAVGYDLAAGLSRYQTWLHARTAGQAPEVSGPAAGLSSTARESGTSAWTGGSEAIAEDGSAADRVLTELYVSQYRSLVKLASLLMHDAGTAEEVVQDAFIEMHRAWPRLASTERAESYLRQSVVSRCRSALRHRVVADRKALTADEDLSEVLDRGLSDIVAALRELPARQREVLVLRFYANLSEAEIAESMGISRGAVRLHTARAISALRLSSERSDQADRSPQPSPRPDAELRPATGRERA